MRAGTRFADRFTIERLVGEGGAGRVYRARDETSGRDVAVKLLLRKAGIDEARLLREAETLATLDHPSIVRHLAHGKTAGGELWLAMEWVGGEPLAARLARARPAVENAVALGRSLAGALAAVHARGLVHRDVKPSNVLVRGESYGDVTLIDFGTARSTRGRHALTTTGSVIGTPKYMAPEQVIGEPLDARADVYALGCVLYCMLAGRPPFDAESELAVLARVLLEDAAPIAGERADVPAPLAELVDAMLAKHRDERPADAAAVLHALTRIERESLRPVAAVTSPIGTAERRVLSLLLARRRAGGSEADVERIATEIEQVVARSGAEARFLADGTLLVSDMAGETPTDRALVASRLALELARRGDQLGIAVVTGRSEVRERGPVGELIDRGAALLPERPEVRVDDETAGLLRARFDIEDGVLLRERSALDARRKVLGRRTPFVGRDWESGALQAMIDECLDERAARVALVSAVAGAGKTRLAQELVERVEPLGVAVLWGRGDALAAGSPFRLLADAIAQAAELGALEASDARRERLLTHVREVLDEPDATRVAELLGEMMGVRFDGSTSERLRAARREPRLLGDAMRAAFEDWIGATCKRGPLLLVLDDLQWAGAATVSFVDSALRQAAALPIMVLGLARPEVEREHPGLWHSHHVQVLRLRPLVKRAGRTLVEAVLPGIDGAALERILERAGGHAFHLEELVRAFAEGQRDAMPDTVLGMIEARLDALDPEARRVLRAASVFGDVFWAGGVRALTELGEAQDALLAALVEGELVQAQPQSSVPGETELAFRNALVREAAYASLTEEDRVLGHRVAGAWLESQGGPDPLVLAEHFRRGASPERAIPWYQRAAAAALAGYDPASALRHLERGIELGASGATRARLDALRAEALHVRGEYEQAAGAARASAGALEPSSAAWFHALHLAIAANASLARIDAVRDDAALAAAGEARSDQARSAQVRCLAEASGQLLLVGNEDLAVETLERARDVASAACELEPHASAMLGWASAHSALHAGDRVAYLRGLEAAAADFERAGDARYVASVRIGIGYASGELGLLARAEEELRTALASAERLALPRTVCAALSNLGQVLLYRGDPGAARDMERRAIVLGTELGNLRHVGASRAYLALALHELGEHAAALDEARRAVDDLAGVTPVLPLALGARGRAALSLGELAEARDALARAMELLGHETEAGEMLVRLAWAGVLRASGEERAALEALDAAKGRLRAQANAIEDDTIRAAFLSLPVHAAVLVGAIDPHGP